jgi:hypothetical protein
MQKNTTKKANSLKVNGAATLSHETANSHTFYTEDNRALLTLTTDTARDLRNVFYNLFSDDDHGDGLKVQLHTLFSQLKYAVGNEDCDEALTRTCFVEQTKDLAELLSTCYEIYKASK